MCEYDEFSSTELLMELGLIERESKSTSRDECDCTGVSLKMKVIGDFLTCSHCGNLKTAYEDLTLMAKGPSTYQVGSRTYTCYGTGFRDKNDKIADMVTQFKNKISANNRYVDPELLNHTCTTMFDITSKHIKKKDNRLSLFAMILYYKSICMGKIMTYKEIKLLFKDEFRFSKGSKIISNALLRGEIRPEDIGAGMKIHDQLIAKYLSIYDYDFQLNDGNVSGRNINTDMNRKFCITVVEIMLQKNIAYNTIIQSKCSAVVYYLVRQNYRRDEAKQRKYFAGLVDVGENTFMTVYMTLLTDDVQRILRESGKLR